MKRNKLNNNYTSEEGQEIKRFAFILIGIIVIVLAIYGIGTHFKKEEENSYERTTQTGKINYDKVSVGTMFNKKESEYYVFLYGEDDKNVVLYDYILDKQKSKKDGLKIFYCDITSELNKDYYVTDGKTNKNAKTIDDVKFGEVTLVRIKNGKIIKYIENVDEIKKELGI